ncbi:hypothetical protein MAR_018802, partial [Mya arenaria]
EGDLKQFTAVTNHHEARHGYDASIFIPTNRPQCVQDQYALCDPNPTLIIRSADAYRKDGLSGSKMFKCWPVLMNEQKIRTPDLNLSRSIQRVRSFDKKYKQPRVRPKTIHGMDDFKIEDIEHDMKEKNKSAECLLTPSTPEIVSIDTSGTNFERMQSFRNSGRRPQQSKEEKEKRKKRRRTVSGVQNIMSEIEKFDRRKKHTEGQDRTTPRSYSFDDLDTEDDIERDEAMLKYLDEVEGKFEERIGEEKAQKLSKFFPCRRSKSLPRCIKLSSVTRSLSADRKSVKDFNSTYGSSSLSIHSIASNASSRLSRSTKRSSMIGNKIKSLVTGQKDKPKPRPKSFDIDTLLDAKAKPRNSIEEKERSKSTYSLERNHIHRVPDNLLSKEYTAKSTSKSSSTIGPGSYYSFESNTLPRVHSKKYDFPWESLPKDWTTSVKLREISQRRAREDRQSSSGNWSQSGTSSNRHSLDSDLRSEEPKFTSQYSLGKDSGRDSLTLEEETDCVTDSTSTAGYAADAQSTITGDSVSVGNPKSDFTQLDTEAWIQSLAIRAAKKEAQDAEKFSSLSRLTRQNILALDLMLAENSPKKKIDDECSVYSVDQEGFYTSFHNDSGLKRSTNTLIDEDQCDISPSKDSTSVCSGESVIYRSTKDKFAGLRKGNSSNFPKVLSKVTPPLPPERISSNSDSSNTKLSPPELHSFPSQDSSIESDAEAVFTRVHDKTNLSRTGFPSLVALSTSDDESSPETKLEKQKNSAELSDLHHIGSDLGLSSITCASQFSNISLQNGSFLDNLTSSSPSLKHSKSVLECTDQGYDSILKDGNNTSKPQASYQSWPRTHRNYSGILKSTERPLESTRPPKTINFAPVVNLFKEGYQDAVQVPLPSPTNSSASESNVSLSQPPRLSSFKSATGVDQSYNLAVPVNEKAKSRSTKKQPDLPLKYQPVITVTPRARSRSGERKSSNQSGNQRKDQSSRPVIYATATKPTAQSTPHVQQNQRSSGNKTSPNLYAVSPVMAPKEPSRQNSTTSTNSNGSNYMDMQSLKSADSFNSLASADCMNFNGNGNYMTMSSPSVSPNLSNMDFSISSTPSGSMDSLLDMRKTPTNELENDTYQINTNLHTNRSNGYNCNGSEGNRVETVPIVTQMNPNSAHVNGYSEQSSQSFTRFRTPDTSYTSSMATPGRRSLDSTDSDLTRVTQMTFDSSSNTTMTPLSHDHTPGSRNGTPVNELRPAESSTRQAGRRSRADTRKEPSYRNVNATHRRSLPSDMSTSVQVRHVPLNDMPKSANQNQSNYSPNNTLSSSRSYPLGFNSVLVSNSGGVHGNQKSANNPKTGYSNGQRTPPPSANNDQFSSRSDSYRVAMGNPNTRTNSYRNAMHTTKSMPLLPATKQSGPYRVAMDMSPNKAFNDIDDDVLNRADSYRIAVRNTNGIVPDMGVNTPNRYAVNGDIPSVISSKLDALSMDDKTLMTGRDVRRMGITDVDQVKGIKAKPVMKESKSVPIMHQVRMRDPKSQSSSQVQMRKSDSKGQSVTQNGRIRKVTTHDVDPIEVVQTVDNSGESRKTGKNNPNRSSTYIQFDPIFEDTEDLYGGMDLSSMDYSKNLANTSKSKLGLINGTVKDANANTVKNPKNIQSGKNIEVEDNWRFSQV